MKFHILIGLPSNIYIIEFPLLFDCLYYKVDIKLKELLVDL